jgi:hypothetical protein
MLYLTLGQLIHEERQREIERRLEARRLLDIARQARSDAPRSNRIGTRQTPAGATP